MIAWESAAPRIAVQKKRTNNALPPDGVA